MSKPGFELQWTRSSITAPAACNGLQHGVTANGVTLFVPMSIVAGSSNNVYAIDNDTGYVVWQRQFEAALPRRPRSAPAASRPARRGSCRWCRRPIALTAPAGRGRGVQAYRSVIGEPGQGVPLEGRGGGRGHRWTSRARVPRPPRRAPGAPRRCARRRPCRHRAVPTRRLPAGAAPARSAQGGGGGGGGGGAAQGARHSRRAAEQAGGGGGLGRPSGVVYAISSDGMLHVLGLPSGKDIQKSGGVRSGQRALVRHHRRRHDALRDDQRQLRRRAERGLGDRSREPKPSRSCRGRPTAARSSAASRSATDGTVFAAIGPGTATGDGKANAIVALDPKTLQVKDWFTAAGRGIRDRPDDLQARRSRRRRRGHEGRPDPAAERRVARRRRSRDAAAHFAPALAAGGSVTDNGWRRGRN